MFMELPPTPSNVDWNTIHNLLGVPFEEARPHAGILPDGRPYATANIFRSSYLIFEDRYAYIIHFMLVSCFININFIEGIISQMKILTGII